MLKNKIELKKLKKKKTGQHISISFSGQTISTKGSSKVRFPFRIKIPFKRIEKKAN